MIQHVDADSMRALATRLREDADTIAGVGACLDHVSGPDFRAGLAMGVRLAAAEVLDACDEEVGA